MEGGCFPAQICLWSPESLPKRFKKCRIRSATMTIATVKPLRRFLLISLHIFESADFKDQMTGCLEMLQSSVLNIFKQIIFILCTFIWQLQIEFLTAFSLFKECFCLNLKKHIIEDKLLINQQSIKYLHRECENLPLFCLNTLYVHFRFAGL